MRREIVAEALGQQRAATIRAFGALGGAEGDGSGPAVLPVADRAARLVAVDRGLVTGRLVWMLRNAPDRAAFEAALAASARPWRGQPAERLLETLTRGGERVANLARRLPSPLAGLPVRGWFGRQPFSYLFVRSVLEEWVCLSELSAADEAAAPPAVGHCLSVAVLSCLPAVALPRVGLRSGVVRLVVDVAGAQDVQRAAPGRRRGRWPPPRRTWSFDFARKHYGPRVTQAPDAVVRLSSDTLALLAEGRLAWRAAPTVVTEGDAAVAGALLDAIPPPEGAAGATRCTPARDGGDVGRGEPAGGGATGQGSDGGDVGRGESPDEGATGQGSTGRAIN